MGLLSSLFQSISLAFFMTARFAHEWSMQFNAFLFTSELCLSSTYTIKFVFLVTSKMQGTM